MRLLLQNSKLSRILQACKAIVVVPEEHSPLSCYIHTYTYTTFTELIHLLYISSITGDGTVPYASLAFCKTWKGAIPNLIIDELPEAEHREILANVTMFKKFIEYVAHKPSEDSDKGASKVSSSEDTSKIMAYEALKQSGAIVLEDINDDAGD